MNPISVTAPDTLVHSRPSRIVSQEHGVESGLLFRQHDRLRLSESAPRPKRHKGGRSPSREPRPPRLFGRDDATSSLERDDQARETVRGMNRRSRDGDPARRDTARRTIEIARFRRACRAQATRGQRRRSSSPALKTPAWNASAASIETSCALPRISNRSRSAIRDPRDTARRSRSRARRRPPLPVQALAIGAAVTGATS